MLKENDTSNMGLLTEKLSEGFNISEHITVGRSTVITLRKRERERLVEAMSESINRVSLGSEYTLTSGGI